MATRRGVASRGESTGLGTEGTCAKSGSTVSHRAVNRRLCEDPWRGCGEEREPLLSVCDDASLAVWWKKTDDVFGCMLAHFGPMKLKILRRGLEISADLLSRPHKIQSSFPIRLPSFLPSVLLFFGRIICGGDECRPNSFINTASSVVSSFSYHFAFVLP